MMKNIVIFGATGAVGTALAERLSEEQPCWKITAVSRKANGSARLEKMSLANVTVVAGDPYDKGSVLEITKDADIVVSCIGLHKYQAKFWAKHFPVIVENLLAGTAQEGRTRRLVFCDNLYAYGAGHGDDKAISPSTQTVPPSMRTKPQIRSFLRQRFEKHMKKHPGTLAVVGGSDFFGPRVTETSFLGDTMTGKIVQGQSPLAIGSATVIHDFCYVADFAKAMAVACTDDRALDKFWICPHTIHGKTLSEIANDIARKAGVAGGDTGKTGVQVTVLPSFVVYLLSPFMDFMWEMIEMLPFWTKNYKVDDSDFCQTFNVKATPYDQALDEYVAFYKSRQSN